MIKLYDNDIQLKENKMFITVTYLCVDLSLTHNTGCIQIGQGAVCTVRRPAPNYRGLNP